MMGLQNTVENSLAGRFPLWHQGKRQSEAPAKTLSELL